VDARLHSVNTRLQSLEQRFDGLEKKMDLILELLTGDGREK
jgi:hypothetical protein